MARSSRREYWRGILARQSSSGLSVKAFCARERVSYQSFFIWKRKFRDEPAATTGAIAFAPVTVVAQTPAASGLIEIALPREIRVVVRGPVDRQALADVLAVVGAFLGAAAC